MLLFPAIDLMDGCAVRLQRGAAASKTIYSDRPVETAQRWEREGGDWLHLVDLDGAFEGSSQNLNTIAEICAGISIPVELGGGLRDLPGLRKAFDCGIARAILGTSAAQSTDFVAEAIAEFGAERIAVGIDARDGIVSVKGWTEASDLAVTDFVPQLEKLGVTTIIYTDIATDGMLAGPNFTHIAQLLETTSMQIIASGGVSRNEDVLQLQSLGDLYGTIIGKALYTGDVDLTALAAKIH